MESLDLARSPYVKELYEGYLEEGYFLLRRLVLGMGKNKKPYLRVILADKTGYLPAVYFSHEKDLKELQEKLASGDIVRISGVVENFHEIRQIRILKMEKAERAGQELSRFARRTPHDRRELLKEMRSILGSLKNKSLKKLVDSFLEDRVFLRAFVEAPASRYSHYPYIGGLLEHTLHVMQILKGLTRVYPHVDEDLAVTGGFLHNLGKVDEYRSIFYEYEISSEGRLKGQALLGYDRIVKVLDTLSIDEMLRLKIEHILISHQGRREWGAIAEPRFLEAYLVHMADALDSSQFLFSEPGKSRSSDENWSSYIPYLKREIFLR